MIIKDRKKIIGAIMENYDEFIEKAGKFNEMTNKIDLDYNLNLNDSSQLDKDIQRKADEIRNNVFKIFVTGEAKSGKSTFINAFLGIDLLPSGGAQCTSSIVEIKNGEEIKLIAEQIDGYKIEKFGEIAVKEFLNEKASILGNSKDENNVSIYEGVPFNIVNDMFLKIFKGQYNESDIENFLKEEIVTKEKPSNLQQTEYNENIKNYIKKTNWETIIEKIIIEYPADYLKEVTILDSPGVGAVGGFGEVTEKAIKKADAIIFIKSIPGGAMDSVSFKKFFESIDDKKKDTTFLVLTFKNTQGVNVEERQKEAYEKFNELKRENIFFVDSLSELNFLNYKNFNDIDELEDFLAEDEMKEEDKKFKNEFASFSSFLRKNKKNNRPNNVDDFIEEMKKYSGIYEFKEKIEPFMYVAPFYKLQDFLEKLIKKSEEIRATLQSILKKAKENIGNPKELRKSIDKSIEDIKDLEDTLNNSIESLRKKYISSEEDSVIKKQINEFKDNFLKNIETKTSIELMKSLIYPFKSFNEIIKEEIDKFFKDIENIKKNIIECFFIEGNEILLKNKENIDIKLESILPEISEEEIENMFKEAKENSKKEVDDASFFDDFLWLVTLGRYKTPTKTVNDPKKEKELIYENTKLKILEITPKIQKKVMDDIKIGLKEYTKIVKANLNDAKERLKSFSKQLKDTEKAEKAIEITKNIDIFYTESIKKFNESIDNVNENL
jgi:hypothetical protein